MLCDFITLIHLTITSPRVTSPLCNERFLVLSTLSGPVRRNLHNKPSPYFRLPLGTPHRFAISRCICSWLLSFASIAMFGGLTELCLIVVWLLRNICSDILRCFSMFRSRLTGISVCIQVRTRKLPVDWIQFSILAKNVAGSQV